MILVKYTHMDIFDKIIKGEIPSCKVHEDDFCIIILDIAPVRKGHCLVISKKSTDVISGLSPEEISHIFLKVNELDARMRKVLNADAVNIFINDGRDAGQEVPHVHVHVVPRFKNDGKFDISKKLSYNDGEAEDFCKKLKF